jgi:dodecin
MLCATHTRAENSTIPTIVRRSLICGSARKECIMSEHVYKVVELVGSSKTSIEEAVQNAISKAAESLRNLRWFEVTETRGYIEQGKVAYWQVTVKIGFTVEG